MQLCNETCQLVKVPRQGAGLNLLHNDKYPCYSMKTQHVRSNKAKLWSNVSAVAEKMSKSQSKTSRSKQEAKHTNRKRNTSKTNLDRVLISFCISTWSAPENQGKTKRKTKENKQNKTSKINKNRDKIYDAFCVLFITINARQNWS